MERATDIKFHKSARLVEMGKASKTMKVDVGDVNEEGFEEIALEKVRVNRKRSRPKSRKIIEGS